MNEIELELNSELFLEICLEAHKQNITLNKLITNILEECVKK